MFMIFWWTALGLALFSLLVMGFLILRRLWLRRRQKLDEERKTVLKGQLFTWEDGTEPPNLSRRDRLLLMELGHHLLNTVRGEEARRIARLLQQSGAVREEIGRLRKRSLPERVQAAVLLADLVDQDNEVRSALKSALENDREASVRLTVARALVDGGSPPSLKRIIDQTWYPGEISVRSFQALLRQKAAHAPEEISTYIQEQADCEDDHQLLALLTDALSHGNDLRELALLRSLATDGCHADVRAAAFRALGSLGHPSARSAISIGLTDENWAVRGQAIICASRIGLREFTPRIAEALADPQWWVRFRAGQALLKLGPLGLTLLQEAARGDAVAEPRRPDLAQEGPETVARAILAENGL